jgi:predicted Zn-dependent protease
VLSAQECREVVERVLARATAEQVSVSLSGGETSHLRFARNAPSTGGNYSDSTLSVTCSFGLRSGTASVNQLDERSLSVAVERAEAIARRAPEDPEAMPSLEPQQYPEVRAWSERSAGNAPELIADGTAECLRQARASGLVAAGFSRAEAEFRCFGNERGLFAWERSTEASFSETARTPDGSGSGWAAAAGNGVEELDYARCSRVALEKARLSRDPGALEPGSYPAILEPACVANLLALLVGAMDARSADEGRSFFSAPGGTNRIGESLFPASITLRTDPSDPGVPGRPWGEDGLPQRARDLVRDGRLASLSYDRYWAKKQGVEPVPDPSNVLMEGGTGTLEDLIRTTDRGVLVTSLWYIRSVDPRTLLHTGLTRDGVFWVENGEIVRPLTNFRWNDSPVAVLKSVLAMSAPVRTPPRASNAGTYRVPALRVASFTLSSVSEAV